MQSSQPHVSLILPNRNNEPVLDLFFEALVRNTDLSGTELIVVDDGSTDRSVAALERWRASGWIPRFELIRQEARGIIDSRCSSESAFASRASVDPSGANGGGGCDEGRWCGFNGGGNGCCICGCGARARAGGGCDGRTTGSGAGGSATAAGGMAGGAGGRDESHVESDAACWPRARLWSSGSK